MWGSLRLAPIIIERNYRRARSYVYTLLTPKYNDRTYRTYRMSVFCKTVLKDSLEKFGWSSGVAEKLIGEVGCMLRDCTWCEMKKAWMMEID